MQPELWSSLPEPLSCNQHQHRKDTIFSPDLQHVHLFWNFCASWGYRAVTVENLSWGQAKERVATELLFWKKGARKQQKASKAGKGDLHQTAAHGPQLLWRSTVTPARGSADWPLKAGSREITDTLGASIMQYDPRSPLFFFLKDPWGVRDHGFSKANPYPPKAGFTVKQHVPAKSLQWCLTLCSPMDRSPPGSSVHGILQARTLEWVAMPSSRGSSWPRGWICIS